MSIIIEFFSKCLYEHALNFILRIFFQKLNIKKRVLKSFIFSLHFSIVSAMFQLVKSILFGF